MPKICESLTLQDENHIQVKESLNLGLRLSGILNLALNLSRVRPYWEQEKD